MNKQKSFLSILCTLTFWLIICSTIITESFAQDIEPRRWTTMPLGVHAIGAGYGYTSGDIFFDPLLQAEDVSVDVNTFAVFYIQPFRLGNKLARLDALIPYNVSRWNGLLAGAPATVERNGFSDPRLRFSVNLIGPNAMGPKEMKEYMSEHPVSTTVGVSLAITFPLGQYFEDKILNLGQNRFVFRPQVGMAHNWRNWSYELTGSVYIYTNNPNFNNGALKKQDPIFAFQSHLIRRFKYKIWASISVGYGLGGQSIVNRLPNDDERGDFLGALSFGFPIVKNQALKIAYLLSRTTKDIGMDLNTIAVGWSFVF